MITLEVHPAVFVHEIHECPEYSTCYECHRSFHAKSEDQLCLELCDQCFDNLRHLREPILSVHVKARPRLVTNRVRHHENYAGTGSVDSRG